MNLVHVPTVLVALIAIIVMFGAALAHAGDLGDGSEALRHWHRAVWLAAAGSVMLVARLVLPEVISIVAGNALVSLSLLMIGHALHLFLRHAPVPRWQVAMVPAVVLVALLMCRGPMPPRTAALAVLFSAQLLPSVWLVVRHARVEEPSMRLVGITLGLTVMALLFRAVHASLAPEGYTDFFVTSTGNGLTYMAAFLFPLGAGFALLLAALERSAGRLQQLATHDGLTGCANRHLFDVLLRGALEQARRDGSPVSLLVLDLDHFKVVNDRHGHQAGDAVLKACASALQGRLRAADQLARLGGEEFAVVLPKVSAHDAQRVAEDLRVAVGQLDLGPLGLTPATDMDAAPPRITVSIGIATTQGPAPITPDALYGQADRALYAAKDQGRDRSVHAAALGEPSAAH